MFILYNMLEIYPSGAEPSPAITYLRGLDVPFRDKLDIHVVISRVLQSFQGLLAIRDFLSFFLSSHLRLSSVVKMKLDAMLRQLYPTVLRQGS